MLAGLVCEAPVAMVSLVDAERQWAKAVQGDAVRELQSLRQAPLEIQSPLLDSSLRQLRALRDNPGSR